MHFEILKHRSRPWLSMDIVWNCPWLQHHVMNSEGKMFCDIGIRYDSSGSFSVTNTN